MCIRDSLYTNPYSCSLLTFHHFPSLLISCYDTKLWSISSQIKAGEANAGPLWVLLCWLRKLDWRSCMSLVEGSKEKSVVCDEDLANLCWEPVRSEFSTHNKMSCVSTVCGKLWPHASMPVLHHRPFLLFFSSSHFPFWQNLTNLHACNNILVGFDIWVFHQAVFFSSHFYPDKIVLEKSLFYRLITLNIT